MDDASGAQIRNLRWGIYAMHTHILGVIMFLRFGRVVGQSGLWLAIAIVLMATLITGLTTLSLSAIATNTRVRWGRCYLIGPNRC